MRIALVDVWYLKSSGWKADTVLCGPKSESGGSCRNRFPQSIGSIRSAIRDGWEDCVDASDEGGAVPTIIDDCGTISEPCDTIYITEYETIFDTIINTEYIYEIIIDTVEVEVFVPEYIFVTDTLWMEGALDTLFIDVIEYVDVFIYDTIVEIEYIEFIEYITEYVDCDTGLPCNSSIPELLNKYEQNGVIYNINGQAIRESNGLYIQNGKVKFKIR